uniref:Transposase n=1 Tax=Virgibacillus oceani TaxID=1479511 RepID=A0A917HKN5_9BACI|nr:hypothetical protein GCM10011398_30040 [Virgibacillus oceani]
MNAVNPSLNWFMEQSKSGTGLPSGDKRKQGTREHMFLVLGVSIAYVSSR